MKTIGADLKITSKSLYLAGFSILLVRSFLYTTMYCDYISGIPGTLVRLFGYMVLIAAWFLGRKPWLKRITPGLIFMTGLFLVVALVSGYNDILDYLLCIVCADKIHFRALIRRFIKIEVVLTLLTILSSLLGIIENYTYVRSATGSIRQAMGFVYPTNFAAHIFFLACAMVYYFYGRLKAVHGLAFFATAGILYRLTDGRLDCIMIIGVFVLGYWTQCRQKKHSRPWPAWPLCLSVPVCAAVALAATLQYDGSSSLWKLINSLFSSRLSIAQRLWSNNTITVFGQYIAQKGNGKGGLTGEYTYIDISFMRILLMYGVLMFVFLLLYSVLMSARCINRGNYILPVIFLLIGVNSMVAQHFVDFSYNPFLICTVCSVASTKRARPAPLINQRRIPREQ